MKLVLHYTAIPLLCFFLCSFNPLEWIPPPQPMVKLPSHSNRATNDIPDFIQRHKDNMEPRHVYELALLNIRAGHYNKARDLLIQTTHLDPHFVYAWIQLGYLNLWEGYYDQAYEAFFRALEERPCEIRSCEGLRTIGEYWIRENSHRDKTLYIFQKLYACDSKNPDTLFFLGNLFLQMGKLNDAEWFFKKCLEIDPYNKDARLGLANLYLRDKNWDAARKLYEKYPEDPEALKGIARIESRQGNASNATLYYQKALEKDPTDTEAQKEYARTLASSWRFQESTQQYDLYLIENFQDASGWEESLNARSHAKLSLLADTTYTKAEENDPTLGVPVVNDYYSYTSFHTVVPVDDRLLFDLKWFFYNQKETNIYVPGLNYNASLSGGQITAKYLFANNFLLNGFARLFNAWPQEDEDSMAYPFRSTTRFEPGLTVEYSSPWHIAFIDAHVESFVTKDFDSFESVVIGMTVEELHYLFRPEVYLHPQLETSIRLNEFWDGNFEDLANFWARFGLPFAEKNLIFQYQFQYSHFSRLTPNYFSYKQQYWNFVGGKFRFHPFPNTLFEAIYAYSWQFTRALIQPIGDFLNVANIQSLRGNKITCSLSYRWKHHLLMIAEGHYFRNTLIYRDWNVKGSLLWQF